MKREKIKSYPCLSPKNEIHEQHTTIWQWRLGNDLTESLLPSDMISSGKNTDHRAGSSVLLVFNLFNFAFQYFPIPQIERFYVSGAFLNTLHTLSYLIPPGMLNTAQLPDEETKTPPNADQGCIADKLLRQDFISGQPAL